MRRGATGCAVVVSRRVNLAAVSSQFWKTVRVAQHQAATPPCLSRGEYSFNSSEDGRETIIIYLLLNLALYFFFFFFLMTIYANIMDA